MGDPLKVVTAVPERCGPDLHLENAELTEPLSRRPPFQAYSRAVGTPCTRIESPPPLTRVNLLGFSDKFSCGDRRPPSHWEYELQKPRKTVPDVLVAVCTVCDEIVAVPFQSSPKLNEVRKADDAHLEARIPKHLEDVLAVVGSHYGRNDGEFRAAVLRHYLHTVGENDQLARRVRDLAQADLAKGKATGRLSLKVQKSVLERAWARSKKAGVRKRTDMLKGTIVAAVEDLEGASGRKRRETLEGLAATV